MVEVYSRPLKERYVSSRCSFAYLFRLAYYIALAICPIYIAYSTGNFWRRVDSYLEQPRTTFTKDLILIGHASDGSRVLQYSTIEKYNYLIGYEHIRQPAIRSWSTDVNLDEKADSWDIQVVFPLLSNDAPIISFTAILFFQMQFNQQINVDMNGMMQVVGGGGGVAGNHLLMAGDLEWFQRNPLARQASDGMRTTYQMPLINSSTLQSIADTDLGLLLLRNEERNETVRWQPRSVWSTTPAPTFNFSAHITVPALEVRYVPGSGETIKFAFIQWLAVFWLMHFGLKYVREFVYSQNMVETTRMRDGTPIAKLHQF